MQNQNMQNDGNKNGTQHGFVASGADGSDWTLVIFLYFCLGGRKPT